MYYSSYLILSNCNLSNLNDVFDLIKIFVLPKTVFKLKDYFTFSYKSWNDQILFVSLLFYSKVIEIHICQYNFVSFFSSLD